MPLFWCSLAVWRSSSGSHHVPGSKGLKVLVVVGFRRAFSQAVEDFDSRVPGSLKSGGCLVGVVAFLFLLEMCLQGVPCWLVWLCVLRCQSPHLGAWLVAGSAGLPSGGTGFGLLPGVSFPDFVPFGALGGLVPCPLIGGGFSFPGAWFVQLPGWLHSGLAKGLLRESPRPFGLRWRV